jgi:hypothetical protein
MYNFALKNRNNSTIQAVWRNFTHAQNEIGSWLLELQTDEQLSGGNFTDETAEMQLNFYASSYSKHAW